MRDTRVDAILVPSRGQLRPCWKHLGSMKRKENLHFNSIFSQGFGIFTLFLLYLRYCSCLAGLFWQRLGSYRFLGPPWPVLGPSWGHLGALLGPLGALLGPLEIILGLLGALLELFWSHLGRL